MKDTYVVMLDCCPHGQCDTCWRLPYGTTVRVQHIGPVSKAMAERVAANWAAYKPTVSKVKVSA